MLVFVTYQVEKCESLEQTILDKRAEDFRHDNRRSAGGINTRTETKSGLHTKSVYTILQNQAPPRLPGRGNPT